jgi:hypothetical protein
MKFEKFLISDTAGKKSLTATAFALGFVVANAKLLLAGMTIYGFSFGTFSGVEYAAAIGALGSVYVLRRSGESSKKDSESN